MIKRLRNKIKTYFVAGTLVILPTIITIFVFWKLFVFVDNITAPYIKKLAGYYIPGLGIAVTLAIIFLVGMFTANIVGRRLVLWGEAMIRRVPLVGSIYLGIKQLIEALSLQRKRAFRQVVLIEYPRKGVYCVGFIPSECKGEIQRAIKETLVNVFIFTTPNPTSGMLIMVNEKDIVPLKMSVEEGLKLVVSGGIITPP